MGRRDILRVAFQARPVTVAREEPHARSRNTRHHPETVVLDLEDPARGIGLLPISLGRTRDSTEARQKGASTSPGTYRPVLHGDQDVLFADDMHWGYRSAWAEMSGKVPMAINTRLEKNVANNIRGG